MSESRELHLNAESFAELLRCEFELRKERNPKYSMRSFANKLGVDQSLLSKVINGKRSMSISSMETCLRNMNFSDNFISDCLEKFSKKVIYHRPVEEDVFSVISDWYHFAILELLKIKSTTPSAQVFAHRLGVPVNKIEDALERLERFDFIKIQNGRIELSKPNNTWTSHVATTDARKKLQKDLLLKSIHALENISIEERHHSSYTFAVSSKKLEEIKDKILEQTIQLGNIANQSDELDDVYQLTISLYPLTRRD